MRRIPIAGLLPLAGCAAADAGGGAPMTAIYSPPVRLGGTGTMLLLPGRPGPGDSLPPVGAFRRGGSKLSEGAQPLADEAACRERIDMLAGAAAERYPTGRGVDIVAEPGRLTLIGRFDLPSPTVLFSCFGKLLVRQVGMLTPHGRPEPVPLPPIVTAPAPR